MPQASVAYTYDARNLPLLVSRPNGVSTSYSFDTLGRVLSIVHSRGASAVASLGYSYDITGNRISQQTSSAQPLITQPATATYDDANRLIQRGSTTFAYDENGNLISENGPGGVTTYNWDSRNRLKSHSAPNGQKTGFAYDFAGNLISQNDSGPVLNLTRDFVVDEITNVAYERSSDGDQSSILTGQSIDSHLATVHANGRIEYTLTDAINSTISTVDQSGATRDQFFYEPFGQTTTATTRFPFQYTGRIPVSDSIYYYRARFYSTEGRFLSEDPTGMAGGDVNLYRYVLNRPTSFSDPEGLFWRELLTTILPSAPPAVAAAGAVAGVAITVGAAAVVTYPTIVALANRTSAENAVLEDLVYERNLDTLGNRLDNLNAANRQLELATRLTNAGLSVPTSTGLRGLAISAGRMIGTICKAVRGDR